MIRSILLGLALTASLAGCGKKKAPAAPGNAAPSEPEGQMRDESKPDDPDDQEKTGADPCDGGE